MEKTEIRRRYDPAIHTDPSGFVDQFSLVNDRSLATMSALAAAFTPYTESLCAGLLTREGGILIPENLSGNFRIVEGNETYVKYKAFGKPGNYDSFDQESFPWLYNFSPNKVNSNIHDVDPKGFLNISIPIGNFGKDTAVALVNATRALYVVIDQEASKLATIDEKFSDLVDRATYYGYPPVSFMDGIKSTAEAFAFLTNSSTVPGFEDDPIALFRTFIENGTFNKLGRLLMAGDLPTLISAGLTPVEVVDPKTLSLKKEFVEGMMKRQRAYREKDPTNTLRQTDFGCPLSLHNTTSMVEGEIHTYPDTGINYAAALFLEYFDYYYNEIKLKGFSE